MFRRRLAETQRFTELPVESRYNLAASSVDDDTLERAGEPFGAPYGESGFGTSDVFNELLSYEPKSVKISDLQSYQQSLVNMGYAYDVPVDGNWSPYWAASSRRADRDALNNIKSGGNFASTSAKTVFRYLSYTIPSEVFKGVYGIANGIVSDAARAVTHPVEVLQEGGALGGAAVGAGIGAGVGSIVPGAGTAIGALVGGAVGGVAGFFGDLFDDDEDEEGTWHNILGALSPLDEIKSGDAKNLFAALSTIMTASAILKSGAVAAQGVRGGLAAASPTIEGATVAEAGLRESFRLAGRGTVEPGLLGQIGRTTLKHRVLGTAGVSGLVNAAPELVGGDFAKAARDFEHGALFGAALGVAGSKIPRLSKALDVGAAKVITGIEAAPLARLAASPAGKITQALYTGVAGPTIVARGVGELSGKSGTAIGEDIETAPNLPGTLPKGIPGIGGMNVADLTFGSVIFPERILPWRGRDVSDAFTALGSNHELLPFAEKARRNADGSVSSLRVGFERARQAMGKTADGGYSPMLVGVRSNFSYLQAALNEAADEIVRVKTFPSKEAEAYARQNERANLVSRIFEEAGSSETADILGSSPTAKTLIDTMKANPRRMQTHLDSFNDFDHFATNQAADEFLQLKQLDDTFALPEGKIATTAVRGEYLTAQDYERAHAAYESSAAGYKQSVDQVDKVIKAAREAEDAGVDIAALEQARTRSGEALDNVLNEMRRRGLIEDTEYSALRPGFGDPKVDKALIERLDDGAKLRPRENEGLTDALSENGFGRYVAIETPENVIQYSHFIKQAEIAGLTEYSRSAGFLDGLASLGARADRADVGRLRYQSISAQLDKAASELLNEPFMDGQTIASRIYSETRSRYDPEFAARRGEKIKVRFGSNVVRENVRTGKTTSEWFKISPADLTPEDIIKALDLEDLTLKEGVDVYEAAHRFKKAIHVGQAFGADVAHPIATARAVAAGLKLQGAPEIGDFIRTLNVIPTKFVLKSERFKKGSYGYLSQNLRRTHMALQFGINPLFDISRYMEGTLFGKVRGGDIPVRATLNPRPFIKGHEEGFLHPFTGERVKGEEALAAMSEIGDRILYGKRASATFDELQYRLVANGIAGYKPREVENAQAMWLASQKVARKGGPLDAADLEEIRERVMQINQYGTKQTAFGNTAHFVFFPFLFSRKQLSAITDFTLGAPTRNLLLHEGLRRWYEINDDESLSSKFAEYMQKHLPLAQELQRINNLAYGVSPGRFFLEGIMDKDTEGKVVQGLTEFLLPGGVHQPVADVAGQSAEVLKNFFIPVVLGHDGETLVKDGQRVTNVSAMEDLVARLVPVYRDIDRWFFDEQQSGSNRGLIGAQLTASTQGASPYAQMSEYLDAKKVMTASLEKTAQALGYASWDSLRSASPELAAQVNDIDLALGEEFPQGKELAQTFTNTEEIKEQTIYAIANKDGARTQAEEAILAIGNIEHQMKMVAAQTNLTQEEVLRSMAPAVRVFALGLTDDRQFMALWEELFQPYYGPLIQAVAA